MVPPFYTVNLLYILSRAMLDLTVTVSLTSTRRRVSVLGPMPKSRDSGRSCSKRIFGRSAGQGLLWRLAEVALVRLNKHGFALPGTFTNRAAGADHETSPSGPYPIHALLAMPTLLGTGGSGY